MAVADEAATESEMWDLANYVVSLARKPVWSMTGDEVASLYAREEQDAKSNPAKRGEYLVNALNCALCHWAQDSQNRALPGLKLAGGMHIRIEPFGDCSKEQLEQEIEYFAESARMSRVCQRLRTKLAFVACLMFQRALLVCSGGIVRRECIEQTGGFDPKLRLREDVDFYVRVMRRFGVHFVDQVGLKYRIGFPSLMHASELTEQDQQQLRQARMHTNSKYMREHGFIEFYALKLFARGFLRFL